MTRSVYTVLIAACLAFTAPAPLRAQTPVFPANRIVAILEQTATDCTRQWGNAHKEGSPERYDWIIEAVRRVYVASGGTVGGNWRRAIVGDLSMDGLSVLMQEPNGQQQYYFADVIAGAGGPNPRIVFAVTGMLRDGGGAYAPHGFVKAGDLPPPVVGCGGTTIPPIDPVCPVCPTLPPRQPYPDENSYWRDYELKVVALYQRAFDEGKRGSPDLDSAAFRWFARPGYDIGAGMTKEAAAVGHLASLAKALGLQ